MPNQSTVNTITRFMRSNGWTKLECTTCHRTFFSKGRGENKPLICGWRSCGEGNYAFLSYDKPRKLVTPQEVHIKMKGVFESLGFICHEPLHIAIGAGSTDLVVAGVQIFDSIIHSDAEIFTDKMFISQPSVRTQFQQDVSLKDGIATSFVNICTEHICPDLESHLKNVDNWYTALSKASLHMKDFIIVMRESNKNWGTGDFTAVELFLIYGGLELGDATIMSISCKDSKSIMVSDIGLGLERLAWAINKTGLCFETSTPISSRNTFEMVDLCKTIALLVVSGVKASPNGPGLQFRRFAKILALKYYSEDIYPIIEYYLKYWKQFVRQTNNETDNLRAVRLEIDRFINLRIKSILQLPPPQVETVEEYCQRMVFVHSIDIEDLRSTIQKCRK